MNIVQARVDSGRSVVFGGTRLPLNAVAAELLSDGDLVTVGIRPIDIQDADFAGSPEDPVIDVSVRVREYLGWATVLMFEMENAEARSPVIEGAEADARSIGPGGCTSSTQRPRSLSLGRCSRRAAQST